MFEPIRGGTRGGQAEFKWSDVSADKDRENYLGHSINAPTGRWQKNKDVHWYVRDVKKDEEARLEEIRLIKEQEAEALAAALGFANGSKAGSSGSASAPGTGANAIGVAPKPEADDAQRTFEKEEKRRRKSERKEEKRARKEMRRAGRATSEHSTSDDRKRRVEHSRSRSPRRRRDTSLDREDKHRLLDSRPPRSPLRTPPTQRLRAPLDYDDQARERERERDRRRWEHNQRRELPGGARWGRE